MNAKLTQDELQAIKERAEKATAGPWELDVYETDKHTVVDVWLTEEDYLTVHYSPSTIEKLYNGDFIAAARQDIPRLVAEVERLQSVLFHERVDADHAATHMDYLQSEVERLTSVIWRISDYCDLTVEETRRFIDGGDDD